jgi:hypothetical protein
MEKINDRNTDQSAGEGAGTRQFRKSQSLRLDKQTIRTLTGAELRLVGGGVGCGVITVGCHGGTCGPHSRMTF